MSRVSEELGTGSSFGRARGVSARRQAVAATTGVATAGAPDSRLKTLPLEQLVPTRFNPRRNFGTAEDLHEFGLKLKRKQLQPAVAVTRDAYLLLWPDEAEAVGTARYVIANGERRYRGSLQADLTTLEVIVDDDIAASRADFLDAVLSENNDREDLDPIERAFGIQTMVEQLGGKAKVAEHYAKSAGWVTQQMYLLSLTPELQQLVSSGELPVRETRTLVKLPPAEQEEAWRTRSVQRQEVKAQPRPTRMERIAQPSPTVRQAGAGPAEPAQTFTAVKKDPPPDGQTVQRTTPAPPSFTAVKAAPPDPRPPSEQTPPAVDAEQEPAPNPAPVPEPRPEPLPEGRKLPYDDGPFCAHHLFQKMQPETHIQLAYVTLQLIRENRPDEYVKMIRELSEQALQES